jgi:hypothetical protein
MKLSIKTRIKFLKAQFVVFMTRKRYVGSYPQLKRFILANFLFLVIGFVGWNISLQVPEVKVTWDKGPLVIENHAQAKFKASEAILEKELTIEEKIAKAFPENPEVMVAVAKAESNLNPYATNRNTNGSRDIGIFQINSVHGGNDLELFDVDKNIEAARNVYDKQGITAWSTVNNGSYMKHLK